jgi:PAS domain S-box-containing protein
VTDPSTDFFERIVETVGTGVGVYGREGVYEYVNPAYASLLGTDPDSLEGREIWTINPDLDRNRFDDYWDSFEVGETRVAETRHEFEGTSTPVRVVTTCGEVDGTVHHYGTIRDITDRKRRRAEREYQRSVLEAQQEATIDGLLLVDDDGRIVSYNDRFVEMSAVPRQLLERGDSLPVVRRLLEQVQDPDEVEARVRHLCDHPFETSRNELEFEDGRVFDRYTAPISVDGSYYGRLWVFRDVTDRVERERLLERQNERLEEFASLVSHDLRNPLNVATGHLELAAAECESDHLTVATEALDRMDELLEDTLSLARSGQRIRDPEPVALAELAERCWTNVGTGEATLRADADGTVRADPSRLAQLLENLFRNAVEHGATGDRAEPDGGDVTVTVGSLADGFYVEDDGPGIPPDEREAVFERGYSTTDGGTGFGLRIATDVVDAHGWEIDVTDGTDGGARFEIRGVDVVDGA